MRAERPRPTRYPFVASIDITDVKSEASAKGQTIDLSLFGCRVTASHALSKRTKVRVKLVWRGMGFVAHGRITFLSGEKEIGIAFTQIGPSDLSVLDKWIAELRDAKL